MDVMNLLLDPNVAYVILLFGFVLAILALFAPGTGLLEAGALILLVLGGFAVIKLPVNLWALGLLIFGILPFLLAVRKSGKPYFLGISIFILVVGTYFLFRGENGLPAVNPFLALLTSIVTAGVLWVVGRRGLEASRLKPSHNIEGLVGKIGDARTEILRDGNVYVDGEEWSARSDTRIKAGAQIRVVDRDGLVLKVEEFKKN